jgi:hypothetical protein
MRTVYTAKDARNRASSRSDFKLSALFRKFGDVTGHCLCWIDRVGGEESSHELFAARQLLHHQAGRYGIVH